MVASVENKIMWESDVSVPLRNNEEYLRPAMKL